MKKACAYRRFRSAEYRAADVRKAPRNSAGKTAGNPTVRPGILSGIFPGFIIGKKLKIPLRYDTAETAGINNKINDENEMKRRSRLYEGERTERKVYVVVWEGMENDYGDPVDAILKRGYTLRSVASAYFEECRTNPCLGDDGRLVLASYVMGDKANTYNEITSFGYDCLCGDDVIDAGLDPDYADTWDMEEWGLVTDHGGYRLDGSDIGSIRESFAGNPRRRRRLDESIDYGSLTQRDQLKMDRLVENLRGAKETLESLCYRGDVEDDETRGELLDMHMAVCKMLDRLPW